MELKNTDLLNALNPNRAIYAVLGNLCKNPRALRSPEVVLSEEDFYLPFHKIVFSAINNISLSGQVTEITAVDIDNYLAPHTKLFNIWDQNNGYSVMEDTIEVANVSTFKYNYDLLKKYSFLRDCVTSGIDISDIFALNPENALEEENGKTKIEKMKLEEMLEHFILKTNELKSKWSISQNSKNFKAGDGLDTLLEEMNEEPEFGYPFMNGYYNAIFRGMRDGKFMLRSANTGGGKTRQSLADMCYISCDEIWDKYQQKWVKTGISYPTLFISTELEKRELQTVMLAFITNVPENVIKDGRYTHATMERLKHGIEVLKRAPIFAVYVDDFSIVDIETIIEQHIIEHNVRYVAFDYIQMTSKLSRTMQNSFGSTLREDQILVQFSGAMKILANKYQIYIISSTQLNRSSKEAENRNTQSLRGGAATADKVDHGVMCFRANGKDLEQLEEILKTGQFNTPNFSHWVYKNRSGQNSVVIWTKMDMATMREEMCFITDHDYNLIPGIEPFYPEIEAEPEELDVKITDENLELSF